MSTGHGAVALLCDREGNRRSGVALATCLRLCGIIILYTVHLWASWSQEGRWAPRLHFSKEYGTLYLYFLRR